MATPDGLQARRQAALRLEPLPGRWGPQIGARDPWGPWLGALSGPGTYGLSAWELEAEAERLTAAGWQSWELEQVLALDAEPAAA